MSEEALESQLFQAEKEIEALEQEIQRADKIESDLQDDVTKIKKLWLDMQRMKEGTDDENIKLQDDIKKITESLKLSMDIQKTLHIENARLEIKIEELEDVNDAIGTGYKNAVEEVRNLKAQNAKHIREKREDEKTITVLKEAINYKNGGLSEAEKNLIKQLKESDAFISAQERIKYRR